MSNLQDLQHARLLDLYGDYRARLRTMRAAHSASEVIFHYGDGNNDWHAGHTFREGVVLALYRLWEVSTDGFKEAVEWYESENPNWQRPLPYIIHEDIVLLTGLHNLLTVGDNDVFYEAEDLFSNDARGPYQVVKDSVRPYLQLHAHHVSRLFDALEACDITDQ